MGNPHTSMLFLPDALRAEGLNVIELDGWQENEQVYYWTRREGGKAVHSLYVGEPNGWMWHHTASSRYVPYVKNSAGQTKANLWMGLWCDGTLYHENPTGVPTVVIASAGPSDYSSGSGRLDVLTNWVVQDNRFNGPQRQSDDYPKWYGNRYYGNTEIVHPGYGEPLHEGVWEAVVVTGAVLSDHFGWSSWRNIAHNDHTNRKVDPRFEKGYPYSIAPIQDDIEAYNLGNVPPVEPPIEPPVEPPTPPEETVKIGTDIKYVRQGDEGFDVEYWQVRIIEVIKQKKFYGNSNLTFIRTEAPNLTPKVWDQRMTDYLSAWTGRNSYGIGPTERIMLENANNLLYN